MRATILPIILALSLTTTLFAVTPPSPAGKLVDEMQAAWNEAKTYEAAFTQEVYSKTLGGEPDTSHGTLSVIKPGKLRWEASDGSLQILNGKQLWVIQTNARRGVREVDYWPVASKAIDSKLLKFLSGKAEFKKLYTVKVLSESPKTAELRLISHTNVDESYIAEIDKSSYLLDLLTIESTDSRTRIKFTNIKTNVPLKAALFEYEKRAGDIMHAH